MQAWGIGAGLGAIGFWGFVAAVVVAGIWYGIRQREAQHETLRRMMESGRTLDNALMEKLLGSKRLDRDLKVAGVVVLSVAPGVALLGWLVGQEYAPWLLPLLGVSGLIACIGLGLLVASWAIGPAHRQDRPVGPYGRMPKF